jgi:UbiA prenyltransferase family protein
MEMLRTLLVLGRVSNLPTVWSNCLAGWWLGGFGHRERLPVLFGGTTFLYLGGMFLNDAFDVEFDRQYRKERPIPAGAIRLEAVWRWGLIWLAIGGALLLGLGAQTGGFGVALVLCIVVYDACHKRTRVAPVLMGLCRFLLYLVAASTGVDGITGWSIWCGLALAAYVVGLSLLARGESTGSLVGYWPAIPLAAPIGLALVMNADGYREPAVLLSVILGLWILLCLRQAFGPVEKNMGRAVAGLLAGIVLVDWLAVANMPRQLGFGFIGLLLAALLLQRVVPAT